MIYVVSGYHRSGTAMMMRAVASASTLVPMIDIDNEALIRSRQVTPDYDPNPHGYWNTPWLGIEGDTDVEGNLVDVRYPDESLIKLHVRYLSLLPVAAYRVIVMERPWVQVTASYLTSFGADLGDEPEQVGDYSQRSDFHVLNVQYAGLVADPLAAFTAIAANGWPIDPARAAVTVDPALYRHRAT